VEFGELGIANGIDGGASSGASRTNRWHSGILTDVIASRMDRRRSCSARTKRALETLSVWVSS
jgi:hypothetical protein